MLVFVRPLGHPYFNDQSHTEQSSEYRGLNLPQTLAGDGVFSELVQRVVLAQRPKSTFQVIDDRPWSVCLRPISPNTRAEMDVMVHWRLFAFRICEI